MSKRLSVSDKIAFKNTLIRSVHCLLLLLPEHTLSPGNVLSLKMIIILSPAKLDIF